MKVVLDTNCLLNIVFRNSNYHNVWKSFLNKEYTLCVSNEIMFEYREIIEHFCGDSVLSNFIMQIITTALNVEFVNPTFRFNLIQADQDDNKFVDCAIISGATYIVSNDKHFNVLDKIDWPKLDRKTLIEFSEILKGNK